MTDALFGTPVGAAEKGCECDGACKRLQEDYELLRAALDNHLEAEKPEVWTYQCVQPNCGKLIKTGPPETRVGTTLGCPVHGTVPLDLVSPRGDNAPRRQVVPLQRPARERWTPEPGSRAAFR